MGLTHNDVIVDNDAKFVIDINTRKISGSSNKVILVQGDNASERVGFSIPRYNDGHDMSETDRITILWVNGDVEGSYIVDDAVVGEDEESVEFTWLIQNSSTQNEATLAFAVMFQCFDSEGVETYRWSTLACSLFSVARRISGSTEAIVNEVADNLSRVINLLEAKIVSIDSTLTKTGYAADAKTTGDKLNTKVNISQGTDNSGKVLRVGTNGNVTLGTMSVSDDGDGNVTLSIK